jgi:uncharacterized protein
MKLPDLNVWLAAVWCNHADHESAARWFDQQGESLAFCRVTQMGLLRLLSNPAVMRGDALTRWEAWDVYQKLQLDPRIRFAEEPGDLNAMWMQMTKQPDRSHKLWTDDYLAAFAFLTNARLVTFDQALSSRHPAVAVELL